MDIVRELQSADKPIDESTYKKLMKEESGNIKRQKYLALYQARAVLSMIGTMPERRLARKNLKIMQRDGIKSV
jgi:hypothetical protein